MNSVEIHSEIDSALKLDVAAADDKYAYKNELLRDAASRCYATAFIVATDAGIEQRSNPADTEELDFRDDSGGARTSGRGRAMLLERGQH